MRILIVSITPGSAVDILAEMIQKHNEHLLIDILPFHPKRYSVEDLKLFEEMAKRADLIDFEYWKSALVLLDKFPWLREKPKILTHHNPYDLDKEDWFRLFNAVVVKNKTQQVRLPGSIHIPHAVDLDLFEFNDDYDPENKTVGMVAFRIEGHKGIKEVAQACKELGYHFLLVGKVSSPNYMKEVQEIGVDFVGYVGREQLPEMYKKMGVLVCNSVDNFECGTMPILEAMAIGVPVLTRNIGLVPDIYDEENMVVRQGQTEDVEDLKNELRALVENKERRLEIREKAWQTVKNFSDIKMAKQYAKLYNQVLFENPLVSVIIPIYNRKEQVLEILEALDEQTYDNIEAIVCDDNSTDGTESAVKQMRKKVRYPIKYLNTNRTGYNLAMARNMGIIEADGEIIVFCDSRLKPYPEAIFEFTKHVLSTPERVWFYGNKGVRKGFVENFSAIRRRFLIDCGMFCERIDRYGGMTQEIKTRFGKMGFKFRFLPFARAKQILKAKKRGKKKEIWKSKFKLWQMYGD